MASGTGGTDIDVGGDIQSLGAADSPVTFTAYTTGENWGELHHVNAEPSTFSYTNITQAGHSPRIGHSNSGPTIRASNSTFVFDHGNLTDNAGKLMHVTSGSDLTFRDCLFARSIMGPEIFDTALLFEDSWITDMHADDDGDGIYIHKQQAGQLCILTGGVAANIDDDAIDTANSEITIENFIIRNCKDKAISVYDGQADIHRCLIVENNSAPEDPTVTSIAAKTHEGVTAIVNIDQTTIVSTKTQGITDFGIQSHNKYDVGSGTIIYNVTNSIIDATDPINVQTPYLESDIQVIYSDVFSESWPGLGNINLNPLFVDPANHDYRLKSTAGHWDPNNYLWVMDSVTSRCIDTGNPGSPLADEPTGLANLRVNLGFYGGASQASKTPNNWSLWADLNNDGLVSLTDYAYQTADWLKLSPQLPGDLNRNGVVESADLHRTPADWLRQTLWHVP